MKKTISLLIAFTLFVMLINCSGFSVTSTAEGISFTTETTEANTYPMQIIDVDYIGPECWLLVEPLTIASEVVFDVYADIDTCVENWHDQVKSVLTLLWSQYNNHEKVMFKIYSSTEVFSQAQPTYEDLIACWQNKPFSMITESKPTIIWYPEGPGIAAQYETENWEPIFD